jgi:hypothetical protein
LWPAFWILTALLVLGLGLARASGLGDLVTDVGRTEARSEGWYEGRRAGQALLVCSLGTLWAACSLFAVWRFRERRRRYLSAALAVIFIAFFAGVRVISLHHIDSVLYNTDLPGARPVFWIESASLLVLSVTAVHAAWKLSRGPRSLSPGI